MVGDTNDVVSGSLAVGMRCLQQRGEERRRKEGGKMSSKRARRMATRRDNIVARRPLRHFPCFAWRRAVKPLIAKIDQRQSD
jgi:hypothetical protein